MAPLRKIILYVAIPLKCRFFKVTRLIFDWDLYEIKIVWEQKNTASLYYIVY